MLEVVVNLTLAQLKEKFLIWESKNEVGGSENNQNIKMVANFAGSGLDDRRKKAFVKKSKRPTSDAAKKFSMECWNCGLAGHLKRDCPQPDRSESGGGGGGGSGYESSGGGKRAKFDKRDGGERGRREKYYGKQNKSPVKSILRKPSSPKSQSPSNSRHLQKHLLTQTETLMTISTVET